MIREIEAADDPATLVPGDPEQIWELASSLDRIGVAFEDIGLGLRSIDDGGWQGRAADAFHAHFDGAPKRFLVAADAFLSTAVALDTYAGALSWAQRQAGEAMALLREETRAAAVELPVRQQIEQLGVLGTAPDVVASPGSRAAAVDTLGRARRQLERIGREAAGTVREAGVLAPRGRARLWDTIHPAAVPAAATAHVVVRTEQAVLSAATLQHPDAGLKRNLDHAALRDNPRAWDAGIPGLRRRLRRLGLDQLSPRLKQHIFDGHYSIRNNRDLGYHHREGGIDRGPMRVTRVIGSPDENGVYRAEVSGPRSANGQVKRSTFFPDAWTRADVLAAIRNAFVNRTGFDRDRQKWRGCSAGVLIEGVVERQLAEPPAEARTVRLYHIVTAYPIYRGREGRGQGD